MLSEELELVMLMPKLQLQQIFGILKSLGLVIRPEPEFSALVDHCHPIQDRRPSSTAPSLSLAAGKWWTVSDRKRASEKGREGGIPVGITSGGCREIGGGSTSEERK